MARDNIPPRIGFLMLVGFVITILFVMTVTAIWKLKFEEGLGFLAVGAVLTYSFYRRRLLALAYLAIGTILALAGIGFLGHPSAGGLLLTLGSAAAGYLLVRWDLWRDPQNAIGDRKTLFDNNPKH